MKKLILIIGVLGIGSLALAEPSYCDPAKFKNLEIQYKGHQPANFHVYKIGGLTLAGMAIGHSEVLDMIALAQNYSNVAAPERYCTWYVNDGNAEAARVFVSRKVPRPTGSDYKGRGDTFMKILGNEFDLAPINFVSCAAEAGYIAIGCDGMKHRGPTVMAMLLAYSGCTPDHAATIATQIWGNNGITTQMRSAISKRAAELATSHPSALAKLKAIMGN